MRAYLRRASAIVVALAALVAGCDGTSSEPELPTELSPAESRARGGPMAASEDALYTFSPPVFDIDATPDGSILVAETVSPAIQPSPGVSITTVKEIRRNGKGGVRDVVEISTVKGSPINGLESIGQGKFYATGGALDLAVGAAVFHASKGGARLVGDIEEFETVNDPDATVGPAWKNPACEASGGFSAGPQSNPYHLARLSGGTVLVADAAGNTLLRVKMNGEVDLTAVFTPPTEDGSGSINPADWIVLFAVPGLTCYVQPVPTSVAVGPDGSIYVGELTGVAPANFAGLPAPGLSRVWRIAPGAEDVVCPSADCQVVLSGLTSVIDLALGPDGELYVLEYDENGWAIAIGALGGAPNPAGGTINRCDLTSGVCEPVAQGLVLPGAITFDKWGDLWLLENNIGVPTPTVDAPTVRRLE